MDQILYTIAQFVVISREMSMISWSSRQSQRISVNNKGIIRMLLYLAYNPKDYTNQYFFNETASGGFCLCCSIKNFDIDNTFL